MDGDGWSKCGVNDNLACVMGMGEERVSVKT
jgi:hypothetical protein